MTPATGADMRHHGAKVVLGEEWISPEPHEAPQAGARRFILLNRSPLARKIITFNLLAILVMVAGVLYMNPFRDSLVEQREHALVSKARLIANVIEARWPADSPADAPLHMRAALAGLTLDQTITVNVYDAQQHLLATTEGMARDAPMPVAGLQRDQQATLITDSLNALWGAAAQLAASDHAESAAQHQAQARALVDRALLGETQIHTGHDLRGHTIFTVATPVHHAGQIRGVVVLTTAAGEIDQLVRAEREQVLQMFVVAIVVSIGLSLVLASTIANPLSELAAAAEVGREGSRRKRHPGRVRIPDLSGRPDEIGRLSGALRGMVGALYDRIDTNEQFAADVAHEIKNPLASLRSAVGTLRRVVRPDQRDRLLDVIEHDVRRLDRLVSDISNASRLDAELVKEQEEHFNLLKTLDNMIEHLRVEAARNGVDFIADLPDEPIIVHGLEGRLAQVFVNLITNAISFCEDGDAIRIWVRKRENRVLVVVEDTGPGIPELALGKIFNRFYSERPAGQFGNNSGLGLAISKQIVEAHGGVIWAENIRPTNADITSDPLGARFVVGLPV
ncbi:MAG: sensor histidine kinase [Paracoccaceae bacterium]